MMDEREFDERMKQTFQKDIRMLELSRNLIVDKGPPRTGLWSESSIGIQAVCEENLRGRDAWNRNIHDLDSRIEHVRTSLAEYDPKYDPLRTQRVLEDAIDYLRAVQRKYLRSY
jgi:hypothetical protein